MSEARQIDEFITVEKYLEGEVLAKRRHEYIDGKAFTMPDPNVRHSDVRNNIMFALHDHVRGTFYDLYGVSLKVKLEAAHTTRFYYPDIAITRENTDPESHYITDPSIVIEVTAENTKRVDLLEKVPAYQLFPNMSDVVVINADAPEIFHYRKSNQWKQKILRNLDDVLELPEIDFKISHSRIYEEITIPAEASQPWFHPPYP